MPTIADYTVIRHAGFTLPQGNGDIDHDLDFNASAVNSSSPSILAFRVDPSEGNVTLQVKLNGTEVLKWPFFNEPQPRSWHEVIPANLLKPTDNTLTVTRSQGPGNFTISDIVMFFQANV